MNRNVTLQKIITFSVNRYQLVFLNYVFPHPHSNVSDECCFLFSLELMCEITVERVFFMHSTVIFVYNMTVLDHHGYGRRVRCLRHIQFSGILLFCRAHEVVVDNRTFSINRMTRESPHK